MQTYVFMSLTCTVMRLCLYDYSRILLHLVAPLFVQVLFKAKMGPTVSPLCFVE